MEEYLILSDALERLETSPFDAALEAGPQDPVVSASIDSTLQFMETFIGRATDWTCRSCRTVLGQVRDGTLRPQVPVESVDGCGVARLPCPTCGRVRAWISSLSMPTPNGVGRAAVQRR
jgi:hypothetical protein